jgi:hypothetical protein
LRRVVVPALLLVLPLLFLTGSLKVTEKLFGTWVNLGESGPARYIWTDDGVGRQFARNYESNDAGIGLRFDSAMRYLPCSQGPFAIDKEWTDTEGNRWFELKTRWSSLAVPRYALVRLSASGNWYESDESLYGYPTAFAAPSERGCTSCSSASRAPDPPM